jgi:hypothetical protein
MLLLVCCPQFNSEPLFSWARAGLLKNAASVNYNHLLAAKNKAET